MNIIFFKKIYTSTTRRWNLFRGGGCMNIIFLKKYIPVQPGDGIYFVEVGHD